MELTKLLNARWLAVRMSMSMSMSMSMTTTKTLGRVGRGLVRAGWVDAVVSLALAGSGCAAA
ncbi:hypothetical protein [Lysobacter antibioticus]|uniref:hypothetical protein n=1 Tax=Lysobacter antibioticus TaxID=84531 RepID=UPI000716479D|nr:hypothetical protein [Lysobacter antibioticus]